MPNAKRLGSGNWRARAYVGVGKDGKKIYKSFTAPTKREAEYLATEFLIKKKSSGTTMTVGDAVQQYIDDRTAVLSPTTIHGYRKMLRVNLPPIAKYRVCDLTMSNVQSFINTLAKSKSAKTVSNVYGLLSAAIKQQDPNQNFSIRLPRKVKRLTTNLPSSADVIAAVRGTSIELPVLTAMWLCLRMSEVRGITKSSIQNGVLLIDKVKVVVGGKDVIKELAKTDATRRAIKLPKALEDMIMGVESEYLVTISAQALYARFVKIMRMNGFDKVRFHDLRHIAASDMNKLGIPDRVAADRGGWATTSTMRAVYQHAFSEDRKLADEIINRYYSEMLDANEILSSEKDDTKDDTTF